MQVGSSANSYEILAKLAEGGMAEIFLARNATGAGVERLVVLKRILPEHAYDEGVVKQFVHEARLASQLQHANIAQVYDVGKLGSSYFFAMEYVHGETVRDVLLHARQRGAQLPVGAVLAIAAGVAAGLHHAHERRGIDGRPLGIVHADVSPSNVIISREGIVKLVDFGIAKAESSTDQEGAVRGKIAYLSPEQCHGHAQLDRRSDLFSLGIVIWEMLTTSGLFRRASDFETMVAIESESTPPPSLLRPELPVQLDALVLKLLAKRPADRFQTAAEVVDAIEETAQRLSILPSPASLARLLRDWFGAREEPWLETTRAGSVKRLVVDSEPVPTQLAQTIAGPMDAISSTDAMLRKLAPARTVPPPELPVATPPVAFGKDTATLLGVASGATLDGRPTPTPRPVPVVTSGGGGSAPAIPVPASPGQVPASTSGPLLAAVSRRLPVANPVRATPVPPGIERVEPAPPSRARPPTDRVATLVAERPRLPHPPAAAAPTRHDDGDRTSRWWIVAIVVVVLGAIGAGAAAAWFAGQPEPAPTAPSR